MALTTGELTVSDISRLHEVFVEIGELTVEDFYSAYKRVLGSSVQSINEDILKLTFELIDDNEDGLVTWDDFQRHLATLRRDEQLEEEFLNQRDIFLEKCRSFPVGQKELYHTAPIRKIFYHQRWDAFLSCGLDGSVRSWSGQQLQYENTLHYAQNGSVDFGYEASTDTLFVADVDNVVSIYSLQQHGVHKLLKAYQTGRKSLGHHGVSDGVLRREFRIPKRDVKKRPAVRDEGSTGGQFIEDNEDEKEDEDEVEEDEQHKKEPTSASANKILDRYLHGASHALMQRIWANEKKEETIPVTVLPNTMKNIRSIAGYTTGIGGTTAAIATNPTFNMFFGLEDGTIHGYRTDPWSKDHRSGGPGGAFDSFGTPPLMNIPVDMEWKLHRKAVTCIQLQPWNDSALTASLDSDIHIVNIERGIVLRTLKGTAVDTLRTHSRGVRHVEMPRSPKILGSFGNERFAILWDPTVGKPLQSLHGHVTRLVDLKFSEENDKMVFTYSEDRSIRVWDIRTFRCLQQIRERPWETLGTPGSIFYHSKAKAIITGTHRLYWKDAVKQTFTEGYCGHTRAVLGAGYCQKEQMLVSCDELSLRVWNTSNGTLTVWWQMGPLHGICLDSRGHGVLVDDGAGDLSVLSTTNGHPVLVLTGSKRFAEVDGHDPRFLYWGEKGIWVVGTSRALLFYEGSCDHKTVLYPTPVFSRTISLEAHVSALAIAGERLIVGLSDGSMSSIPLRYLKHHSDEAMFLFRRLSEEAAAQQQQSQQQTAKASRRASRSPGLQRRKSRGILQGGGEEEEDDSLEVQWVSVLKGNLHKGVRSMVKAAEEYLQMARQIALEEGPQGQQQAGGPLSGLGSPDDDEDNPMALGGSGGTGGGEGGAKTQGARAFQNIDRFSVRVETICVLTPQYVVSSDGDGVLTLWDVPNAEEVFFWSAVLAPRVTVPALDYDPENAHLFYGDEMGYVGAFDVSVLHSFPPPATPGGLSMTLSRRQSMTSFEAFPTSSAVTPTASVGAGFMSLGSAGLASIVNNDENFMGGSSRNQQQAKLMRRRKLRSGISRLSLFRAVDGSVATMKWLPDRQLLCVGCSDTVLLLVTPDGTRVGCFGQATPPPAPDDARLFHLAVKMFRKEYLMQIVESHGTLSLADIVETALVLPSGLFPDSATVRATMSEMCPKDLVLDNARLLEHNEETGLYSVLLANEAPKAPLPSIPAPATTVTTSPPAGAKPAATPKGTGLEERGGAEAVQESTGKRSPERGRSPSPTEGHGRRAATLQLQEPLIVPPLHGGGVSPVRQEGIDGEISPRRKCVQSVWKMTDDALQEPVRPKPFRRRLAAHQRLLDALKRRSALSGIPTGTGNKRDSLLSMDVSVFDERAGISRKNSLELPKFGGFNAFRTPQDGGVGGAGSGRGGFFDDGFDEAEEEDTRTTANGSPESPYSVSAASRRDSRRQLRAPRALQSLSLSSPQQRANRPTTTTGSDESAGSGSPSFGSATECVAEGGSPLRSPAGAVLRRSSQAIITALRDAQEKGSFRRPREGGQQQPVGRETDSREPEASPFGPRQTSGYGGESWRKYLPSTKGTTTNEELQAVLDTATARELCDDEEDGRQAVLLRELADSIELIAAHVDTTERLCFQEIRHQFSIEKRHAIYIHEPESYKRELLETKEEETFTKLLDEKRMSYLRVLKLLQGASLVKYLFLDDILPPEEIEIRQRKEAPHTCHMLSANPHLAPLPKKQQGENAFWIMRVQPLMEPLPPPAPRAKSVDGRRRRGVRRLVVRKRASSNRKDLRTDPRPNAGPSAVAQCWRSTYPLLALQQSDDVLRWSAAFEHALGVVPQCPAENTRRSARLDSLTLAFTSACESFVKSIIAEWDNTTNRRIKTFGDDLFYANGIAAHCVANPTSALLTGSMHQTAKLAAMELAGLSAFMKVQEGLSGVRIYAPLACVVRHLGLTFFCSAIVPCLRTKNRIPINASDANVMNAVHRQIFQSLRLDPNLWPVNIPIGFERYISASGAMYAIGFRSLFPSQWNTSGEVLYPTHILREELVAGGSNLLAPNCYSEEIPMEYRSKQAKETTKASRKLTVLIDQVTKDLMKADTAVVNYTNGEVVQILHKAGINVRYLLSVAFGLDRLVKEEARQKGELQKTGESVGVLSLGKNAARRANFAKASPTSPSSLSTASPSSPPPSPSPAHGKHLSISPSPAPVHQEDVPVPLKTCLPGGWRSSVRIEKSAEDRLEMILSQRTAQLRASMLEVRSTSLSSPLENAGGGGGSGGGSAAEGNGGGEGCDSQRRMSFSRSKKLSSSQLRSAGEPTGPSLVRDLLYVEAAARTFRVVFFELIRQKVFPEVEHWGTIGRKGIASAFGASPIVHTTSPPIGSMSPTESRGFVSSGSFSPELMRKFSLMSGLSSVPTPPISPATRAPSLADPTHGGGGGGVPGTEGMSVLQARKGTLPPEATPKPTPLTGPASHQLPAVYGSNKGVSMKEGGGGSTSSPSSSPAQSLHLEARKKNALFSVLRILNDLLDPSTSKETWNRYIAPLLDGKFPSSELSRKLSHSDVLGEPYLVERFRTRVNQLIGLGPSGMDLLPVSKTVQFPKNLSLNRWYDSEAVARTEPLDSTMRVQRLVEEISAAIDRDRAKSLWLGGPRSPEHLRYVHYRLQLAMRRFDREHIDKNLLTALNTAVGTPIKGGKPAEPEGGMEGTTDKKKKQPPVPSLPLETIGRSGLVLTMPAGATAAELAPLASSKKTGTGTDRPQPQQTTAEKEELREQQILAAVSAMLIKYSELFGKQSIPLATIQAKIGQLYAALGLFHTAIAHLSTSRRLLSTLLGPSHPLAIGVYAVLTDVVQQTGLVHETEQGREEIRSSLENAFSIADYPQFCGLLDLANADYELASALLSSHCTQAKRQVTRTIMLQRYERLASSGLFPLHHLAVYQALRELAVTHGKIGEEVEGVQILEYLTKEVVLHHGPHSPQLALLYDDIGGIYSNRQDYETAIAVYQHALTLRTRAYGSCEKLAVSYRHLSQMYRATGRHEEAVRALSHASNLLDRASYDDPEVVETFSMLAHAQKACQQYAGAMYSWTKALDARETVLGGIHPLTADTMEDIASLFFVEGKYHEAWHSYDVCAQIRSKLFGPQHPSVARTLSFRARTEAGLGDIVSSMRTFKESLEIYKYHCDVAMGLIDGGGGMNSRQRSHRSTASASVSARSTLPPSSPQDGDLTPAIGSLGGVHQHTTEEMSEADRNFPLLRAQLLSNMGSLLLADASELWKKQQQGSDLELPTKRMKDIGVDIEKELHTARNYLREAHRLALVATQEPEHESLRVLEKFLAEADELVNLCAEHRMQTIRNTEKAKLVQSWNALDLIGGGAGKAGSGGADRGSQKVGITQRSALWYRDSHKIFKLKPTIGASDALVPINTSSPTAKAIARSSSRLDRKHSTASSSAGSLY